jgi:hypothetical protein
MLLVLPLLLTLCSLVHARHPDTNDIIPTWTSTTLNDGHEITLATNASITISKNVSVAYDANHIVTFTYVSTEDAMFSVDVTLGEIHTNNVVMFYEASMTTSFTLDTLNDLSEGVYNMDIVLSGWGSGTGRVVIEDIELTTVKTSPVFRIILAVLLSLGAVAIIISVVITFNKMRTR